MELKLTAKERKQEAALAAARCSVAGSHANGIARHPSEIWGAVNKIERYMKKNGYQTFLVGIDLLGGAIAFRKPQNSVSTTQKP